jgi:hypothetical protein
LPEERAVPKADKSAAGAADVACCNRSEKAVRAPDKALDWMDCVCQFVRLEATEEATLRMDITQSIDRAGENYISLRDRGAYFSG